MADTTSQASLSAAWFAEQSRLYQEGGWKKAKRLEREPGEYETHLYSFLIDINICLLPVYIWLVEFLMILCGFIPPGLFDLLFYIMYALLFVVSVIGLGAFTVRTGGQSFGGLVTGLKLVNATTLKETTALKLIFRQALGYGLPIMLFGYFFETWGLLAWWIANAICVFVSPYQQTIVDYIFGLVSVRVPDADVMLAAIPRRSKPVEEEKPAPAEESFRSPIDLHIRSTYSDDGSFDVEEIFKQARTAGLEVISITDHNCARGNAAAQRFAKLYGIQYIPGVEFDCQYKGVRLRVLGYYIDWNNEIFDVLERNSLKREKDISMQRVQKFEEFSGVEIDVDSLIRNSRFQTITARDITRMVFNNARTRQLPLVEKYLNSSPNEREAMSRFEKAVFGKNGPCFVKGDYPNIRTIIEAIHKAGGLAILSSWHLNRLSREALEELMDLDLDGIEAFSPDLDERTTVSLVQIGRERGLFLTCGSDFHGPTRPNKRLGETHLPEKALPLVQVITRPLKESAE